MRRARGCGGRFLNTKKNDGNASDHNPENSVNSGDSLLVSSTLTSQNMNHELVSTTVSQQFSFHLSNFHSVPGDTEDKGDYSGQRHGAILANRHPSRAVSIQ